MVNRVQSGQQLGHYRLLQRLGEGGFAEVYLGEHQYLQHRVAIKVLTIPLNSKEADKFLREARTMRSLKHPHIVGCNDFGIEQGIPFLVMEYAPGGTLRSRYPDGSVVPLVEVVTYISQVAEALQYAHDQGIIHLDVKPENMLLSADGKVLLSDFGIARFTHGVSLKLTSLIGTVAYMAPEFLQSHPQKASDQYALAMVAYEWLAGTHAFAGINGQAVAVQHLTTPPPSLRDYNAAIPAVVDDVILTALAKRPEERYPNISEFAQMLAHASARSAHVYKGGLRARGQGKMELKDILDGEQAGPNKPTEKAPFPRIYRQKQLQIQQEEDKPDQGEKRKRFRKKACGSQLHHQWIVCPAWMLLLAGISTTIGALTQSWFQAFVALSIAGIGGYLLGYRKALGPIALAISFAVSVVLTIALTEVLARLNYAQPIYSVTQNIVFLGRQLNFGLICGAITALAAVITAMIVRPPWGKEERLSPYASLYAFRSRRPPKSEYLTAAHLIWIFLATWIAGAALTAMIALLTALYGWGFGWDTGANVMALGFLVGSVLFVGIGASIPIWWTTFAGE